MSTTTKSAPRVYHGRSIEELIPKIQAELGEDAIVLRRRKGLTGGIGGFFQRPFVEIEAQPGAPGIDLYDDGDGAPALPSPLVEPLVTPQAADSPAAASSGFGGGYVSDALAALAGSRARPAAPAAPPPSSFAGMAVAPEQPDFRELTPESLIEPRPAQESTGGNGTPTDTFAAALAAAEAAAEAIQPRDLRAHDVPPVPPSAAPVSYVPPIALPAMPAPHARARTKLEQSLIEVGIDGRFADELLETAAVHLLALNPRLGLARAVRMALMQRIPACPPLPTASATIALVGPGGSGKTACCAALLGAYRHAGTLPAACATILAGTARNELQMLLSPHILQPTAIDAPHAARALRGAREQGLLLLDLPPVAPNDRASIRTLAALLGELRPDRVAVALPATLGAKPAAQLLEALQPLGASALAITHADETDQLGVAVQTACAFGLAPEYLLDRTRGHLALAQIDPTYLADRLLA
jgi:hypothetical protein